jgi:electron transport complex protein RnfA
VSSLLLILLSAVLVCYYAPMIPALQPFIEADHFESVKGIAFASVITLLLVAPVSYLLEHLLLAPRGLEHLRTLILVIVIMAVAQLAGIAMQFSGRWVPVPRKLVLLTTSNCAVLGVALLNTTRSRNFSDSLLLGAGTGVAFAAMLLMFTALQQRQRYANIPLIFRDAPVALVTVGLMALACMGFSGLIRE